MSIAKSQGNKTNRSLPRILSSFHPMHGMRNKHLTVITSMNAFDPPSCGDENKPPAMLREASALSEKEAGSWGLAESLTNSAIVECWKQGMNPNGWAPLNSPGFVLLSPRQNEVSNSPGVGDTEEANQALTLTLSAGNFSDAGGPPPTLVWNSSGIDGLLMSREVSRDFNNILGPHEDEQDEDEHDAQVADLHFQQHQTPPAPPNTLNVCASEMETDDAEEPTAPTPTESKLMVPEDSCPKPVRTLSGRLAQPVAHRLIQMAAPIRPKRRVTKKKQQLLQMDKLAPSIKKRRRPPQSRGAHVKNRPEMQIKAREGQKHWGTMVQQLRKEWQERRMWEHPHFKDQIAMCTRSHIKSQHECLLRQLQLAVVDKMITASEFSASEDNSFLGWTGFQIVPGQHKKFRGKIESLFATVPKENTLNNSFRRAGLVPKQCWSEAWSGIAPFKYDGGKRATYSQQP